MNTPPCACACAHEAVQCYRITVLKVLCVALARLQTRRKRKSLMKSNCLQEIIHFCNLLHSVVSLHYANSHERRMEGNVFILGQTMRLRHCLPTQMFREKTLPSRVCPQSRSLHCAPPSAPPTAPPCCTSLLPLALPLSATLARHQWLKTSRPQLLLMG